MRAEAPEPIVIGVGGEGGTRHPRCLPPHLLAVHPEYRVGPTAQHPDLFGAERLWQEEVAFLMEPVDLVLVELPGVASLAWRRYPASALCRSVAGGSPRPPTGHAREHECRPELGRRTWGERWVQYVWI